MTYQTLLVRVSFWSVHGRVLKIASPLTSNHDPMSRRRSSNIGRITPSAVGPIFINKFPALTKHVCINTSQSNREGMVTARKAVISHGEYIYLHNWRWSQESRSTRESLGSQKGGRSFERPRLLCQSSWRSPICVSAEHLLYPTTKRVISIKLRFYKSFWQVFSYLDCICLDNLRNRRVYIQRHVPTDHWRPPCVELDCYCKAKQGNWACPSIRS